VTHRGVSGHVVGSLRLRFTGRDPAATCHVEQRQGEWGESHGGSTRTTAVQVCNPAADDLSSPALGERTSDVTVI
jgi:hypothetical protein